MNANSIRVWFPWHFPRARQYHYWLWCWRRRCTGCDFVFSFGQKIQQENRRYFLLRRKHFHRKCGQKCLSLQGSSNRAWWRTEKKFPDYCKRYIFHGIQGASTTLLGEKIYELGDDFFHKDGLCSNQQKYYLTVKHFFAYDK